jgi:hypothetical protein
MKKIKKESVTSETRLELIIAFLAGFLFVFGVAGWMASDGVQLGFKLLQNPKSLAAIATEDGLFTDEGIVSFSKIRGIIENLQLFSIAALSFGAIVCAAFVYRLKKRIRIERI